MLLSYILQFIFIYKLKLSIYLMGWKNYKGYVLGVISGIAATGLVYFVVGAKKFRGERVVAQAPIQASTLRIMKKDLKLVQDTYTAEFLDEKGNVKASIDLGYNCDRLSIKSDGNGIESKVNFED